MSRTQAISYAGRSFWAYDVALGVLLKHMIDAAQAFESSEDSAWLAEQVAFWPQIAVWGGSVYGLDIRKDWSPGQVGVFVSLVQSACQALGDREVISAEEVRAWPVSVEGVGLDTRGADEIRTSPVIELGEAILALVNGSLPPAPQGAWWYFGLPSGRSTIEMGAPEWEWP